MRQQQRRGGRVGLKAWVTLCSCCDDREVSGGAIPVTLPSIPIRSEGPRCGSRASVRHVRIDVITTMEPRRRWSATEKQRWAPESRRIAYTVLPGSTTVDL